MSRDRGSEALPVVLLFSGTVSGYTPAFIHSLSIFPAHFSCIVVFLCLVFLCAVLWTDIGWISACLTCTGLSICLHSIMNLLKSPFVVVTIHHLYNTIALPIYKKAFGESVVNSIHFRFGEILVKFPIDSLHNSNQWADGRQTLVGRNANFRLS